MCHDKSASCLPYEGPPKWYQRWWKIIRWYLWVRWRPYPKRADHAPTYKTLPERDVEGHATYKMPIEPIIENQSIRFLQALLDNTEVNKLPLKVVAAPDRIMRLRGELPYAKTNPNMTNFWRDLEAPRKDSGSDDNKDKNPSGDSGNN